MKRGTNMIAETSKKVGLEINFQKNKILRINSKSQENKYYLRMPLALSILEVDLMKLEAL